MEVLRDLADCPAPREGSAVTVGAYDGVHLGHRAVIAALRRLAEERGLQSALVTFDRHPAAVVRPESAPRLLTDLDQKLELVAQTGLDWCLVLPFDEARSKEPAEDFVTEVLLGCLNARAVVVGRDFHFGHRRRGNLALLGAMGLEMGFEVVDLAPVGPHGAPAPEAEKVSSTRIRAALDSGDLASATRLLGRPHEVRGALAGDGMVTDAGSDVLPAGLAHVEVSVPGEILVPAAGAYAGWLEIAGGPFVPAVVTTGGSGQPPDGAYSRLQARLAASPGRASGPVKVRFVERLGEVEGWGAGEAGEAGEQLGQRDARGLGL